MKRVLALRKSYQAFGRGSMQFLHPENRKILAFVRRYENETILVVANLSRFPQPAQLDLAEFKQAVPVELFGRTEFPAITEKPYFLTLSPHALSGFLLQMTGEHSALPDRESQALVNGENWEDIFEDSGQADFERVLLKYINGQRWFCCGGRGIKALQVRERIALPGSPDRVHLLVVLVEYIEGDPEEYLLPLGFAVGKEREQIEQNMPRLVISRLELRGGQGEPATPLAEVRPHPDTPAQGEAGSADPGPVLSPASPPGSRPEGILYDGVGNETFCRGLLEAIARRRSFDGIAGELKGLPQAWLRLAAGSRADQELRPEVAKADRRNTAILFGEKYFLKLFRRVEAGTNPDLEIRQFLSQREFPHMPELAGSLVYHRRNGEKFTVALMTQFVPQAKSGWEFTMDALGRYLDRTGAISQESNSGPPPMLPTAASGEKDIPQEVTELIGTFLESARLLGQRTAQMHVALASDPDNPAFAPESFTPFYQRSLYQSMRNLAVQTMQGLRRSLSRLPPEIRELGERVVAKKERC